MACLRNFKEEEKLYYQTDEFTEGSCMSVQHFVDLTAM